MKNFEVFQRETVHAEKLIRSNGGNMFLKSEWFWRSADATFSAIEVESKPPH